MASITQTIPNYFGGISEQPDQLKNPGQVKNVVNAIPDVTNGLYKRPGSKRIAKLAGVQNNGSWFHYYRDETEGSYIGQIASDGTPRVWRCSDGAAMTIAYGSTDGATQANLKSYLTPSAAANTEDLQFLTINDTTFVNNRTKAVLLTSDESSAKPEAHAAYIELLRTENGRQYGLNIYDDDSVTVPVNRATRLKIQSDNLREEYGYGDCPGIGTQVFGNGDYTAQSGKKNLTFRLTILGQGGESISDDGGTDENSFRCTYNRAVDLLHGGSGWVTNNTVDVVLDQAKYGATVNGQDTHATYTIKVLDHETAQIKAKINGANDNGLIRPQPTPFDSQCAVTADAILGGIAAELSPTGLSHKVIGNGIYLSSSSAFNVEIVNPDLMRVMQDEVNDVSKLPTQCRHGYIVKVSNSQMSDEDDYYMKFIGQNNKDGPGSWKECAKPGIRNKLDAGTMPVTLQRTAATTFTVDRYAWDQREVGDNLTNAIPSFVSIRNAYYDETRTDEDRTINKVLFFRNRLALLSGPNITTSRPGDFGNFWVDTALTVSAIDPINIASSSTLPSDLYDGLELNTGLLVFSTNSQYLLSSDDSVFTPDTAKLRPISSYNYHRTVPPISLGVTVGFLDNSNKYSKFTEIAGVQREGQAAIIDQSKVVPTLLGKDIDLITNSRENGLVFFGKTGEKFVKIYKYVTIGDQRIQSAWFQWKFNSNLKYHFIEDEQYYYLDEDDFLQSINIVQADADPSIDEEGTNFLIHLDNYTTISGGVHNSTTKLTTFSNVSWISQVTGSTPANKLVLVDINSGATRVGRYAECTVSGTSFTVPGDWSGATLHIGYLYDYQIEFPRIYTLKQAGQSTVADINASLILHRLYLSLGKSGLYETTLTRIGKDDYTDVYESTPANQYNVSDAPYLDEDVKSIPIYDKNKNVDITLKSTHPAPATLRSLTWEGDYSPINYRRV